MTNIEWTDEVWNPVTGCTKVSQGCKNCYAEVIANRRLPHGGFTDRPFTTVRTHGDRLTQPLRWKKPRKVFVNSMSDLFHEDVPEFFIDCVFAVMAVARHHTFQILTKRPERMLAYMSGRSRSAQPWKDAARTVGYSLEFEGVSLVPFPLPNVWLGVSAENQETADERIPLLRQTPAAIRFVSYEPALAVVDFSKHLHVTWVYAAGEGEAHPSNDGRGGWWSDLGVRSDEGELPRPDWIIIGGESGPKARPFDLMWARVSIAQCKAAGVACFVKQLGAVPMMSNAEWQSRDTVRMLNHRNHHRVPKGFEPIYLTNRKGGYMDEWPEILRVRQFPQVPA